MLLERGRHKSTYYMIFGQRINTFTDVVGGFPGKRCIIFAHTVITHHHLFLLARGARGFPYRITGTSKRSDPNIY